MLSDGPFCLHVLGKGIVKITKDGSVSTDQPHLAITRTKQDIYIDTQEPDIDLSEESLEEEEMVVTCPRGDGPRPLKRPCLQSTEEGHLIRKSYLSMSATRSIHVSGNVYLKFYCGNVIYCGNSFSVSAQDSAQVQLLGYPRVNTLQLKARDGAMINALPSTSNGKFVPPMIDVSARGATSVDLSGSLSKLCLDVKGDAEVDVREVCHKVSGAIGGKGTVNIAVLHAKPHNVTRGKDAYLLYELFDGNY